MSSDSPLCCAVPRTRWLRRGAKQASGARGGRPPRTLSGGVAYERIQYDDDQQVSNDIDVEAGPLLRVGIDVRF